MKKSMLVVMGAVLGVVMLSASGLAQVDPKPLSWDETTCLGDEYQALCKEFKPWARSYCTQLHSLGLNPKCFYNKVL